MGATGRGVLHRTLTAPFAWGGKRAERRLRARQRQVGGSGAVLPDHQPYAA